MGDKVRLLSDAIRLGATIHPQIRDNLFDWELGWEETAERTRTFRVTGTCALGAAAVAIGKAPESLTEFRDSDPYQDLTERFPEPHADMRDCPEKGCQLHHTTTLLVTHLNDDHQWTRERIADWLEGLGF